MELPQDLIELLVEFDAADVQYLLIGGYAVSMLAEPRFTKDIDLWLGEDSENLLRADRALKTFGAPKETIEALKAAQGLDVTWMGKPPVRIDLMKNIPGVEFPGAYSRRKTIHIKNVRLNVIDKADLITTKLATGRPQDLLDIESLKKS